MRVKKVNRYYCEFCKKSNCSAANMSKHEKRCTMNPLRECGMCKLREHKQSDIAALVALLPNPDEHQRKEVFGISYEFGESLTNALPALRKASGNCPACIMAALRQRGIPVPAVDGFNFTEECKNAWADFNEAQEQKALMYERQGYAY